MTNRERAEALSAEVRGIRLVSHQVDAIKRALDNAVSDVQAQLDAERKAHAETRAALEAIVRSRHDDLDTGSLNWVAVLRESIDYAERLTRGEKKPAIYTASRTRHAHLWRERRAAGVPIIATWIDEAREGETQSFVDLWIRCASESARATAVVLYAEEGDVLKGAFVEAGCALASGVPIFVVGPVPGSWINHPLVTKCMTLDEAFDAALAASTRAKGDE